MGWAPHLATAFNRWPVFAIKHEDSSDWCATKACEPIEQSAHFRAVTFSNVIVLEGILYLAHPQTIDKTSAIID